MASTRSNGHRRTKQKRPTGGKETPDEMSDSTFLDEIISQQLRSLSYSARVAQHGLDVLVSTGSVGQLQTQIRFFQGDKASIQINYIDPTRESHVVYRSEDFLDQEHRDDSGYSTEQFKDWLLRETIKRVSGFAKKELNGTVASVRLQDARLNLTLNNAKYGRADFELKRVAAEYVVRRVDYYNPSGKKKTVYESK